MDTFVLCKTYKVLEMSEFDSNGRFEGDKQVDSADDNLFVEQDLLMEQILENINITPIGQVLKKIASLPEVRKAKVLGVRQRLTEGQYDLNGRLDVALEKVLEGLRK